MRIDISAFRQGNLQIPDFFYRIFTMNEFYALMYALTIEDCKVDRITIEIDRNINHESEEKKNDR